MKASILFTVFLFITLNSFGQYSRSFYSDETSYRRHSSVISVNGETTVISIRESSNDTLRVNLIDIDENGETSNYRNYEYSPFDVSSFYVLSGIGVNSSGNATLCVLNSNGSGNINISYVTIDPITGMFSNYSYGNGQYRQGFSRTRAKGDSLITYLANSSGSGIQRVARSMSNTGISLETADPSSTYTGTMAQNGIKCELIIDGNDEYMALTDQTIKRLGPNNYIETSSLGFLDAPCLAVNSSGELFQLSRANGNYQKLDGSLNQISFGVVSELQGTPSSLTEIYALANDGIRVWTNRSQGSVVLSLDANATVIHMDNTRSYPLDQLFLEGQQYLVGYEAHYTSQIDIEGNGFPNYATSLSVVSDDLSSSVQDFIEYDQVLSSEKIRFHTNYLGGTYNQVPNDTSGLAFYQNGQWRNLIFATRTNIIGVSVSGDTLGSAITYATTAANGPYCNPGSYSMELMDKYNRGYYVSREMIEIHIAEITSGNLAYKIPFGIREWPAHGDVSLGQAANLAKFVDQNGNSMYEPELGDYPAIYGDQCLLNIYHEHPNSANSSSIETHQYYFMFDCDAEEAIENALFVRTHNFARGELLIDTYVSNYADFDLGNYSDDHVGTNVELGMIYAYNGDIYDETSNGVTGFNDTIPAIGFLPIQGAKRDSDGLDNPNTVTSGGSINGLGFGDAIPDNEYFTLESSYSYLQNFTGSSSQSGYYNVMKGLFSDGSPKMLNGVAVRHDLIGTSDPLFYSSGGIDHGNNDFDNTPGDRRMSCATGPVTFNTVDTMVLLNAYVVGVDTVNLSPENSAIRLFEHGQVLRDFYAQNSSVCGNIFDSYVSDNFVSVIEEELQQILAYPNPANNQIHFRGIQGEASVKIIDLNGRIVQFQEDVINDNGIDISSLERAVYLITISDEAGTQTIRMIKQ